MGLFDGLRRLAECDDRSIEERAPYTFPYIRLKCKPARVSYSKPVLFVCAQDSFSRSFCLAEILVPSGVETVP
jgi:hypothetical protein